MPIVPLVIWGPQRMWTKGQPKNLGRQQIPWIVRAGTQLHPKGTMTELDAALRAEMTETLHEVQEQYPNPEGAFWVPQRLGGAGPSPDEAERFDEAGRAERARCAPEPR